MAAMVALTFLVAIALLVARIQGVKSGKVDPRYFKTLSVGEPTPAMLKASRHFINLFEVPVLFYAACLVAMVLQAPTGRLLPMAWAFVAARTLQAIVHIGPNKVYVRMSLFFAGFTLVMAMWADVVCSRI